MAKTEPWADRIERVRRLFPSVTMGRDEWRHVFRESNEKEVFGALLLVLDQAAQPHVRRGHRPVPETPEEIEAFWQRTRQLFFGETFTVLPFNEAFAILVGERSLAHVASKTKISKTRVRYLLAGQRPGRPAPRPTAHDMEAIAKAFNKPPSYFREYRLGVLVAALTEHLEQSPETSVGLVRRLGLEPV